MHEFTYQYNGRTIHLRPCVGVDVKSYHLSKWITDCLDFLDKNPQEHITYTNSGRWLVMVARENGTGDEVDFVYDVFVSEVKYTSTFGTIPAQIKVFR